MKSISSNCSMPNNVLTIFYFIPSKISTCHLCLILENTIYLLYRLLTWNAHALDISSLRHIARIKIKKSYP